MKLEEQVCSLELANKLKELGVEQESLWWWCSKSGKVYWLCDKSVDKLDLEEYCSAFTVSELGEMLPNKVQGYSFYSCKMSGEWAIYYRNLNLPKDNTTLMGFSLDTEANARAKMLIWLIENGHVKV